jgi:hypothetical protein
MKHRIRAKTIGLLFLSALFAINSNVSAQDPTSPTPSPEVVATQPATPPAAAAAPCTTLPATVTFDSYSCFIFAVGIEESREENI